jgi:fructose/tagatose bisphosphate aldolase
MAESRRSQPRRVQQCRSPLPRSTAGRDGIVQVSTGGPEFLSGTTIKDMVTGSVVLAEFANVVAAKYPTNVALFTDHCQKSWNGSASYGPTPRSSRVCAEGVLNASHLFRLPPRKLFTQETL